uniref:Uncharacterized protein n=1 Tax=viral metagenome TaxID=1070528 RepID=A0A6C0AP90_9ZZZZ
MATSNNSHPGLSQIIELDRISPDTALHNNTVNSILLASGHIGSDILFNNGLHQNTLIIYDMLESMGYDCYLLTDRGSEKVSDLSGYRFLTPETCMGLFKSLTIAAYIEIGMTLDAGWRSLIERLGAKVVKLYLGNILNIDVETTAITKGLYFPHHVGGTVHEIWTSPHYKQNLTYACAINGLPGSKGKIAPYLWTPEFIQGAQRWTPQSWTKMDIVIAEPNLSFQKTCLFPLLLANEFAQLCPEWKGKVYLLNTERMSKNSYMSQTVLPNLFLQKHGRIIHEGRTGIRSIMERHPSALFIAHQYNNDYNYMTLELMECDFPVLHSSLGWSQFGYYWSTDEWRLSLTTLAKVFQLHGSQLGPYRSHAKQLQWKHSPWNPVNRAGWSKLLS